MELLEDINIKALVIGAAIAVASIILGHMYLDWFYIFSAAGLLYAGYGQNDIKTGTLIGAIASTPIVLLTFKGYLGHFNGFFATEIGMITMSIIILLVGAFVGLVGAWAKRDRLKAKEAYEKKQNIGKNKKKKKNKK